MTEQLWWARGVHPWSTHHTEKWLPKHQSHSEPFTLTQKNNQQGLKQEVHSSPLTTESLHLKALTNILNCLMPSGTEAE